MALALTCKVEKIPQAMHTENKVWLKSPGWKQIYSYVVHTKTIRIVLH